MVIDEFMNASETLLKVTSYIESSNNIVVKMKKLMGKCKGFFMLALTTLMLLLLMTPSLAQLLS